MIDVVGARKAFGDRVVLDGITLTFPRGVVTGVVGPSGCGKSTLLRCLVGLDVLDAGEVRVGRDRGPGHDVLSPATSVAIRRRVGLVFQGCHLFGHLTALQNVTEGPRALGLLSPRDAEARGRALLDRVGVANRADAYPSALSGGEQQRVALARALAVEPQVLLLDEPTSALDPTRTAEVEALLRGLAEGGTTVILVSHDAHLARRLCGRVVVLQGGRVVEQGDPEGVLRAYLGTPPEGPPSTIPGSV